MMNNILIIPNEYKLNSSIQVINSFVENAYNIAVPKEYYKYYEISQYCIDDSEINNYDFGIVIGGDGTVISACRRYCMYDLPLLGINFGNLGFLTAFEGSEVNNFVASIRDMEFIIDERIMVSAFINEREIGVGLNDIVISRKSIARMLTYSIHVNDLFVNKYCADGLIVSTPTGSTAYNLSAGGPIITPNNQVLVFTPICSHSLNARSIILNGNDEIKISLDHRRNHSVDDVLLTIDGQVDTKLNRKDEIIIKRSSNSIKLMSLKDRDFYHILRRKLS